MSWHSFTFASTVTPSRLASTADARALLEAPEETAGKVYSYSRNGVLLWTLRKILAGSELARGLYLLEDQAVLTGDELRRQHALIAALQEEILRDPQCVLEATKVRHEPQEVPYADGEPLPYELAYPSNCVVEDGWVYYYTKDDVRSLAASAPCGSDPKPPYDFEGESLEYLFGFLKSHASLLESAIGRGAAVAYAEMNR